MCSRSSRPGVVFATNRTLQATIRDVDLGTAQQWEAEGISRGKLRGMVRRRELVRQRHGTYATAGLVAAAGDDKALCHVLDIRAALAACSAGDAVASHESAAVVHGLPLLGEPAAGIVALTRPPGSSQGRTEAGVRYHAARLPGDHVTRKHGVPATTIARTVVDIARTAPFMDGVVLADAAMRRLTGKSEMLAVIDACRHWPGTGRARRAVEFGTALSGSPLESCARVLFAEHGLPPPELQKGVISYLDGEYHEYRVDFCWEDRKTIAETDGLSKYSSGKQAIDELKRDRHLREYGYKVVHITWKELLGSPERIIERIRRAFGAPTAY